MNPRLQQILDECRSSIARSMLQHLFDFAENMRQRLEQKICEQRSRIGFDGDAQTWTNIEDVIANGDQWEDLSELDQTTYERYKDRAQSQLRRGTYASKSDSIKTATKKRQNRLTGVAGASSRLNRFNNDEYNSNTTS